MWCKNTEKVLRAANTAQGGMKQWEAENVKMVLDLVMKVRGKLSRIVRKILVALITTDVHAKDMIVEMCEKKTEKVKDFMWEQQLRYYWEQDIDDCVIRHANAKLFYCYEYMGCTGRLVITPLTDKCWLTITGAIHLKLGASPAGPAGTGKTESSKDLAKAMGTFCIVFNCSDQIDYIMIGKLFAGLAQCGCWCCLDEFNRILIEVLSVVAQQLLGQQGQRTVGLNQLAQHNTGAHTFFGFRSMGAVALDVKAQTTGRPCRHTFGGQQYGAQWVARNVVQTVTTFVGPGNGRGSGVQHLFGALAGLFGRLKQPMNGAVKRFFLML